MIINIKRLSDDTCKSYIIQKKSHLCSPLPQTANADNQKGPLCKESDCHRDLKKHSPPKDYSPLQEAFFHLVGSPSYTLGDSSVPPSYKVPTP